MEGYLDAEELVVKALKFSYLLVELDKKPYGSDGISVAKE